MLNAKRKRAFTDLGDQRGFFSFDPGGCTSGLINTTRMNAKTCGAVPMVRIHLPPAESLQTLGPSRKLMRIEAERDLPHLDKGVGPRVRISFAPAASQVRTRRGGLRALGLLLGRTG